MLSCTPVVKLKVLSTLSLAMGICSILLQLIGLASIYEEAAKTKSWILLSPDEKEHHHFTTGSLSGSSWCDSFLNVLHKCGDECCENRSYLGRVLTIFAASSLLTLPVSIVLMMASHNNPRKLVMISAFLFSTFSTLFQFLQLLLYVRARIVGAYTDDLDAAGHREECFGPCMSWYGSEPAPGEELVSSVTSDFVWGPSWGFYVRIVSAALCLIMLLSFIGREVGMRPQLSHIPDPDQT